MKILLDENLPIDLKFELEDTDYEIATVNDFGWKGKKNGELLKLLEENEFKVLITLDENITKQQNISKYKISIFVINALNNKIQTLKPFIPKIKYVIKRNLQTGITEINL
jgi:predicted nuclease of predicted toxin-antitoxin system